MNESCHSVDALVTKISIMTPGKFISSQEVPNEVKNNIKQL
jgi:uncharacterized Fe-S cluster-containing MiaB family protein